MDDFITFDLETTGLSPDSAEIIEIGAWKIKGGVAISKYSTLVKPRGFVPREVQDLTGITNEMLVGEFSIEDVIADFYDFCEDLPFLGHNLPFDYKFLCRKASIFGYDFTLKGKRCGIDTLRLCTSYLKNCQSKKLEDVSKFFGIFVGSPNLTFHRAEYDAYITKLVYDRFKVLYPNLYEVTTPELLDKNKISYGKVVCNDTLSFD